MITSIVRVSMRREKKEQRLLQVERLLIPVARSVAASATTATPSATTTTATSSTSEATSLAKGVHVLLVLSGPIKLVSTRLWQRRVVGQADTAHAGLHCGRSCWRTFLTLFGIAGEVVEEAGGFGVDRTVSGRFGGGSLFLLFESSSGRLEVEFGHARDSLGGRCTCGSAVVIGGRPVTVGCMLLLLAGSALTLLLLLLLLVCARGQGSLAHVSSQLLDLRSSDGSLMGSGSCGLLRLTSGHGGPCAIVGFSSFSRGWRQGLLLLLLLLRLLEMLLRGNGWWWRCCCLRRLGC